LEDNSKNKKISEERVLSRKSHKDMKIIDFDSTEEIISDVKKIM